MRLNLQNLKAMIVSILIVMVFWSILSYGIQLKTIYVPKPDTTFVKLFKMLQSSEYWLDILYSSKRVFLGFILSFLLAYPLTLLTLIDENVKRIVFNIVEFFRYLPIPVFIPLTILWFGVGDLGKIFIIFLGTFAQMIPMFYDSAMFMKQRYQSFTAALKWSNTQYLKKIIIPGSLPLIIDNSRLCFGWAWTYLIIAELLGAENGMGYTIIRAQRYLETDKIFAYIITIGIIGVVIDKSIHFIKRKTFKWQL